MKRKIIISLIVSLITFSLFAAFIINYITVPKVENVFDEMYLGEECIFGSYRGYSLFSNIPDIKDRNRREDEYDGLVFEQYKDNVIIDNLPWSISFIFEFPEKIFSIYFEADLQENKTIYIAYDYFTNKQLLVEKVYVRHMISKYEGKNTKNTDKIKKYLDGANVPAESIKKVADELLYNKVIADWTEYSSPSFTKENIGKITIERSNFFEE